LEKIAEQMVPSDGASWILLVEDMREQLIVNINRKVATDSVFLTMAGEAPPYKRVTVR
jgi:hypothetical protein